MERATPLFTPVLLVGCLIILVFFAVRASFGVFQIPIASELVWLRSEFSLAIAIQNLAWGIGQPLFVVVAEKLSDGKAIVIGAWPMRRGPGLGGVLAAGGVGRFLARPWRNSC